MEDLRTAEHPGMHRYASPHGLPELLDALAARLAARTGVATSRDDVLMAAGATGGLGAAVGALVDPGDEVLLVAPYWPLVAGIVRSFHGVPVPVPLLHDPELAASPEAAVEALERRRTARTVAVYWNTPNNPSGRTLPAACLAALGAWARRHDLWILADEVYEDLVYQGEHVYTRPLAPERTVAAHSFSKAYGMAGNRCGYMVGPPAVMLELRKVATHTFYSTPTAAQLAALAALGEAGDAWLAAARAQYCSTGGRAAARLGLAAPQGSTFLFFDVAAHLDTRGLEGFLGDCVARGLLLAPGPSFGPYPTHVRLCFTAVPPEVALRGVEVLAQLLGR
jgi:N-succinyldiaminopimelate aminotransferase